LLAAAVFAPAAVAQMDDDRMMEDDMMMNSASASTSAMSSASAMDEEMMSASASASPLPRTGGVPLLPLLSAGALALMAGSGLLAARLARRSS
jgi:hypothetical protein